MRRGKPRGAGKGGPALQSTAQPCQERRFVRTARLCRRSGPQPGAALPTRVRGAEAARAPGGAKLGFALQGARGARATGTVLRREGRGRLCHRRGAPGGRQQTCALLGNPALFPAPPGVCLAGSLCHAAAWERLAAAAAPGGTPPLRKQRKLPMLRRDGCGASTRLRGRGALGGFARPAVAAPRGRQRAGGVLRGAGARQVEPWGAARRCFIAVEAVWPAESVGAVRSGPVAPSPLHSGRDGSFRWMR